MPEAETWNDWIEKQKQKRRREYLDSVGRLVSDYNQERQRAQEYSGRVLLELIQNANDAGHDQSEAVDIKIELKDEYLIIANTGMTFTKAGVESLFISRNSPKQFRSDCIGYKGLGFRSILNWTSSALIMSGELSIGFDQRFAAEFLEELRKENDKIDAKVQQFESRGESTPIATLVAPKWITDDEIPNGALEAAYDRGQQLRDMGFATVICLALPDDDHHSVQREIAELSEEFALFLQHTRSIDINSPERTVDWQIHRRDDSISIWRRGGTTTTWDIVEETDEIPDEYREPGQPKTRYEIKLAIPESGAMATCLEEPLYVFFPTKVSFPFPVLAHATFEVTDDRNRLVDSATNRFVADRLAQVMVRTAEHLTTDENRWQAFDTVSPQDRVDSTLSQLGGREGDTSFEESLREALQAAQILPVYNGGFAAPQAVARTDADFDGLFEFPCFDDVCRCPGDRQLRRQLQELNVDSLSESALRTKLETIDDKLSIPERATVIHRLVTNGLITEDPPMGLLLDSDGEPITSGVTVFLPAETKLVSLPEWLSQRFLHSGLKSLLHDRFGEESNRGLRRALHPFPVTEYSFSGLIGSIVAEVNQRVRDNPGEELEWRQEMLQIIWELYTAQDTPESFPEQPTVQLPTRTERFAPAAELYIGEEYPEGQLAEALYQPVDPGTFVAAPSKLGVDNDPASIKNFLCWLGVADEPRKVELTNASTEFREHILQELSYPARFNDLQFDSKTEIPPRHQRYRFENFSTIDRLDKILKHADPHAIIALLTTISDELESWRRRGDEDATFKVKPKNKQKSRRLVNQSVPAHPVWLLESKAWLPVANGERMPPTRCSISTEVKSLSPVIGYPAVDYSQPLFEAMNIDDRAVSIALQHAGVAIGLEDLSWYAFYRILLHLPELDPDGEYAERVYKLVLSKDGDPEGKAYNEFQGEGLMWGERNGDQGYYPVSDLRFPEGESLPSAVMERYPIVAIPTRESTAKVNTRFNVSSLSMTDLLIADKDAKRHDHADWFSEDVQRLKPFIYGLRMDTTRESQDRNTIKNLEVKLCESYTATAEVEGEEISIALNSGSYLIWDNTAYLVPEEVPAEYSPLRNENLASIVGEIFATRLELDIKNEVYMLASTLDREKTFEVLTGEDRELLQKARDRFETSVSQESRLEPPDIQPSPPETTSRNETGDDATATASDSQDTSTEPVPPVNEESTNVTVEKTESKTIETREVSIQRVTAGSRTPQSRGRYRIADGDRAETICMIFEESQGRHPLKVAHIRGRESYGCDIISFETAGRRDRFQDENNAELIDRYIEVKASATDTGTINLKGSQLRTARQRRENFFLYRAFESSANATEYELVVLEDPLGDTEASTPQVKVNPFRTGAADSYELHVDNEQTETAKTPQNGTETRTTGESENTGSEKNS